MPVKKDTTTRFLRTNVRADEHLGALNQEGFILGSKPKTELDKLKEEHLRNRLNKIREMEADLYLKKVEDEYKKQIGTSTVNPTQNQNQIALALLSDPNMQEQFLSRSPEEQQKLIAVAQSLQAPQGKNQFNNAFPLLMMLMNQNKETGVKDMVELIKVVSPPQQQQPGITVKDVLEIVKTTQPQQNQQSVVKDVLDVVKPIYQEVSAAKQETFNQLLQRMDDSRVNPIEWIKEVKTGAEALGINQNNPQLMLELEKMRGDRQISLEQIKAQNARSDRQWQQEMEKWRIERQDNKESDARKWDMVGKLAEGPLGNVAQTLGGAAATKITGRQNPTTPPPNTVTIQCPSCSKMFTGPRDAPTIQCPFCNAQLTAVTEPKPNESKPEQKTDNVGQGVGGKYQ